MEQGIETATFHILTPYPGTALYERMHSQRRITTYNWDLYDTRHVVYQPKGMSPETLEAGYWKAYRDFYRWNAIFKGASVKNTTYGKLRHVAYAAGWKKFEPAWDWMIRLKRISRMRPMLETVLTGFGRLPSPENADTSQLDHESLSLHPDISTQVR